MKKFLTLLAAGMVMLPAAALAQSPGEIIGGAVIQVDDDVFKCRSGEKPCKLRQRTYNELDPSDFFGSANPVDGFPKYGDKKNRYFGDAQLTGNYPSGFGQTDLNWYSVWDGVTDPDQFDHVGYYGAQSQVVTFAELGNPGSPTCLPVASQTACFLALSTTVAHSERPFGPAGPASNVGGLSPIPRPEVTSISPSSIQFNWEEASAYTMNDGAPNPVLGYRLFFQPRDRYDHVGPSETELSAELLAGNLIEATPGTYLPLTTTTFTLSATDPALSAFDPATQSLVAAIKLVYAHQVESDYFSANSFPAHFNTLDSLVTAFEARLQKRRVQLSWRVDGLAGIEAFNVLRSDRDSGPFYPISRNDVAVSGARGTYTTSDPIGNRMHGRASATSYFYSLEIIGLDGSRTVLAPVEVDTTPQRRGNSTR